jgi:hypothetical protein
MVNMKDNFYEITSKVGKFLKFYLEQNVNRIVTILKNEKDSEYLFSKTLIKLADDYLWLISLKKKIF